MVVSIQQRVRSAERPERSGPAAVGLVERGAPPESPGRPAWTREVSLGKAVLENGRLVQTLKDGTRIRLTVEPEIQQTAERLLRRYQLPYASIVMLSVRTGRVLAMAGYSKADPALTARQLALQAWAPAASVFKLVTSAALIERNKARPMTRVCYHGGLRRLTAVNLTDDPKKDKICHTLADAIGMSLNPVIGKLARRRLSRDELLETANRFGWNAGIDFDLQLRSSLANIPKGELARARVAAGFWHTTLSPLHGALLAQVFANGGVMVRPQLVDEVLLPGGRKAKLPASWKKQVITPFTAKVVGRMMVLTTTVGTAKEGFYDSRGRAYLPSVKVAAKTGTLTRNSPKVDYNWLVGFAPFDRPQVAFAILLGNELRWRTKPHFLARQLLQAVFARPAEDVHPPSPKKLRPSPPRGGI
ncbi:MAG: penicillin-binding transpeptidase domain-containing protein [bacterium]